MKPPRFYHEPLKAFTDNTHGWADLSQGSEKNFGPGMPAELYIVTLIWFFVF